MITPRLHRRALARSAQWRVILIFWAALIVPGWVAVGPIYRFLSRALDHSPRAKDVVAWLDGATFIDLVRRLDEPGGAGAVNALQAGLVVTLLVAPFVAAAMVAAARSDEPLPLRRLLAGAGEFYGRMLRTGFVGLIPLGIGAAAAGGISAWAFHANDRAIRESEADHRLLAATIAAASLVFVFHALLDLTRAQFAADATRRSAFLALWASVRVVIRRPLRVFSVSLLGAVVALLPALFFMAVRLRISQRGAATMALAWLLAQLAQGCIGWGRAVRIFGLAELVRADTLDRRRTSAFVMDPPLTSPAPPPETFDLPPPAPEAPAGLPPREGSGT